MEIVYINKFLRLKRMKKTEFIRKRQLCETSSSDEMGF